MEEIKQNRIWWKRHRNKLSLIWVLQRFIKQTSNGEKIDRLEHIKIRKVYISQKLNHELKRRVANGGENVLLCDEELMSLKWKQFFAK